MTKIKAKCYVIRLVKIFSILFLLHIYVFMISILFVFHFIFSINHIHVDITIYSIAIQPLRAQFGQRGPEEVRGCAENFSFAAVKAKAQHIESNWHHILLLHFRFDFVALFPTLQSSSLSAVPPGRLAIEQHLYVAACNDGKYVIETMKRQSF